MPPAPQLIDPRVLAQFGIRLCSFTAPDPQHYQALLPPIRALLGYAEGAPLSLLDVLHPDSAPAFEQHQQQLLAAPIGTAHSVELQLQGQDQAWGWYELRQQRQATELIGVLQDISQRKAQAQAQEVELELYRQVFDISPVGIAVSGLTGQGRYNRKLCELLGYEWTPDIQIDLKQHTPPEDQPVHRVMVEKVLKGEIPYFEMEKRYVRRDGRLRWVHLFSYPLYRPQGEIVASISMTLDVTERRRIEQERQALIADLEARNAEMERFIYTVSHDLKSPLITIQGFLGYLEGDIEKGNQDRVRRDIQHINDAILRMQSLLEDLLELSRIGRVVNPSQMVSLDSIIMEAIKNVTGQLDALNAVLSVQNDLPKVYVDRRRIVEVYQNLLDNALKFMGEQPHPFIRIGAEVRQGWVKCYIQDNGAGIDPRYQEKIFGLFERIDVHTEGTGIGLAIVKRIIETHQGKIWLESAGLQQGTTFYFTLPTKEIEYEPKQW